MTSPQPPRPLAALSFLARHHLGQVLLGAVLAALALRALCYTIHFHDLLARISAGLLLCAIPILRVALPGGQSTAATDLNRGWERATRWLALTGWWRLFFFALLSFIGISGAFHAIFLGYSHELAFFAIIFGLLAIPVAKRVQIPESTEALQTPNSDTRPSGRVATPLSTLHIALIVLAILAALTMGFAAGWGAHMSTHDSFSISDKGISIQSPDGHTRIIGDDRDEENDAEDDADEGESKVSINKNAESKDIDIVNSNGQKVHIHKDENGDSHDILITGADGKPQVSIHNNAEPVAPPVPPTPVIPAAGASVPSATGSAVASQPHKLESPGHAAQKAGASLKLDDDDSYFETFLAYLLFLVVGKILSRDKHRAELDAASARIIANCSRLEREVADAKLAAMQAQIEPHFLFNTLASIDQLIQSDPPRASRLQKSLIQFLRAAIPQIRSDAQRSTLGRQAEMSLAYLEIMQMRMEERLHYEILIAESLRSAEFPSMMLQTLIENAIKHGLEPAPEGGNLIVRAEQADNRLTVSVSNGGMNYAPAPDAAPGTGLANIRDRLQLLYGDKASFTIATPANGGCLASISIPFVAGTSNA
jgi:hypothetical protein